MTFKDLGLALPILKAIEEQGYTQPTPIQEQSIPILLNNKDLLGVAQTGTGKTAAFSIPIIHHLHTNASQTKGKRKIKALIITPTRELAIQIAENFTAYSKHTNITNTVIFGGIKQQRQVNALRPGVDALIATPGRLLDLMNQNIISLRDVQYVVLDEADQMLDMGFIHDIKKVIAKLPAQRQSLFFSATMPKTIVELSRKLLGDFERVTIKPKQATAERVDQGIYFVSKPNKVKLLVHLINERPNSSVLVFSRTKHGANKIVKKLDQANITSSAIHGNKSQTARQKALNSFKEGTLQVLIATDIAARGIDVEDLSLVINFDLPNVPETYVHRIGRTGRASASGIAISFCDKEERAYLRDIEKLIKQEIPRMPDQSIVDEIEANNPHEPEPTEKKQAPRSQNNRNNQRNSRRKNSNFRGKNSHNSSSRKD